MLTQRSEVTLPRIYYPNQLSAGDVITLPKTSCQHVLKSLRLRDRDDIVLFNGQGGEFQGILNVTSRHEATVTLTHFSDVDRESSPYIHLGQCLSRHERMDYAIQKSVEVGVSEITPILSERCQVKLPRDRVEKRLTHWRQVIISACEQSGRTSVPRLNPPCGLMEWIASVEGTTVICNWSNDDWKPREKVKKINLLVGPEGGFSPEESLNVKKQGVKTMSLGVRTLRTETAPVVAIVLLQNLSAWV